MHLVPIRSLWNLGYLGSKESGDLVGSRKRETCQETRQGGRLRKCDLQLLHPDGVIFWVSENSRNSRVYLPPPSKFHQFPATKALNLVLLKKSIMFSVKRRVKVGISHFQTHLYLYIYDTLEIEAWLIRDLWLF